MLLQQIDDSGYPTEYLAARLGVRKSALVRDWQPVLSADDPLDAVPSGSIFTCAMEYSPAGVWQVMLREYRWVRRQLNETARRYFMPFFVWLELKTIMLCMRNLQARKDREVDQILDSSMLSNHVREMFATGSDPVEVIQNLEPTLAFLSGRFCGATDRFISQGAAGLESWLNEAWLQWVGDLRLPSGIRGFFVCMVDCHNIMRLYKAVRWELERLPHFLSGGRISKTVFSEALTGGERDAAVAALVRRFTGKKDADLSTSPENALLNGVTRQLHRDALVSSGYGRIVEYLWLLYIETRNMAILLTAATTEERLNLATELLR